MAHRLLHTHARHTRSRNGCLFVVCVRDSNVILEKEVIDVDPGHVGLGVRAPGRLVRLILELALNAVITPSPRRAVRHVVGLDLLSRWLIRSPRSPCLLLAVVLLLGLRAILVFRCSLTATLSSRPRCRFRCRTRSSSSTIAHADLNSHTCVLGLTAAGCCCRA